MHSSEHITKLIFTVATTVLCCQPTVADTIFDNGMFTADGGSVASDFSFPTSSQYAEDFILASDSVVKGVNWWGTYPPGRGPHSLGNNHATSPPVDDNFTIRIFSDSNGKPSDEPFVEFVARDLGRADTGVDSFGSAVYAYSVDFQTPIVLGGDVTYWLSVVNDTPDDFVWFWQRVTRFSGTAFWREIDDVEWLSLRNTTIAFNLQGSTVPEPSCLLLFSVSSLCVLTGSRQRMRVRE